VRVGVRAKVIAAVVLAVACGGKSVRTERANGDAAGDSGATTSGGATAMGGTGAAPTGGAGSPGESGGTAGSVDFSSCSQPLGWLGLTCNVEHSVGQQCARGGCHDANTQIARLDLTPNEFLVARVLNVPASFGGIEVNGVPCVPVGCPEPGTKLLVDAENPLASWVIEKMEPFPPGSSENTDIGCGFDMPMPPGTAHYTEEAKQCLRTLFLAIAGKGTACGSPGERPPVSAPPRCPPD